MVVVGPGCRVVASLNRAAFLLPVYQLCYYHHRAVRRCRRRHTVSAS
jgi:hypothetical protein